MYLWVAVFTLGILGVGFYWGTGSDMRVVSATPSRSGTLTLSLWLAWEMLPSKVTAKPHCYLGLSCPQAREDPVPQVLLPSFWPIVCQVFLIVT